MNKYKFSVILPVYKKVSIKEFESCFNSIIKQSLLPDELLIVIDGPIKDNIKNFIFKKHKKYKFIKLLKFSNNNGLGYVLNKAVKECKYNYIARCDADDISIKNRFQLQINFFKKNKKIDVLGTNVYEVKNNKIYSKKVMNNFHEKIAKKIYLRNPINHSTVFFKKKTIMDAGNYEDVRFYEDYFLWFKVFKNKGKFHNLDKFLVKMKVDDNFFKRRSGIKYLEFYLIFLKKLKEKNFINSFYLIFLFSIRLFLILMPLYLLKKIYKNLLRY